MSSENDKDDYCDGLSPIDADIYLLDQHLSDTTVAQNNVTDPNELDPTPSGNRKRKQPCTEEGSTKKQCQTFRTGESSTSQQQPEGEEPNPLKILKGRIYRLQTKDKMHDMEAILKPELRPKPRPDLQAIIDEIKIIEKNKAGEKFTSELKEVKKKFDRLSEQRREDQKNKKTVNVELVSTNEKLPVTVSSLSGQTTTDGPALVGQDQGSLQTEEQSLATVISSLENEVYDPENIEVGVPSFQGLQEAVKSNTWGTTPDYLEPIATRIKVVRPANKEYSITPLLVYAAIKEMEDTKSNNLNLDMLRKWRATLNRAKLEGFQVADAEDILFKNFSTYCMLKFRGK